MQKFLDLHQRFCAIIEEEAQEKLSRAFTDAERQALRRIPSLLLLEALERELLAKYTTEEAEQWLETLVKVASKWEDSK